MRKEEGGARDGRNGQSSCTDRKNGEKYLDATESGSATLVCVRRWELKTQIQNKGLKVYTTKILVYGGTY